MLFKAKSAGLLKRLSQGKAKDAYLGTSLAKQWLRLCMSTAGGTGSIPGQGTSMPCGVAQKLKKKKKMHI